jgi:type II secretory ATPase GspE/PulE/Tfp pilus assembly ATPase PilB-like protein
MLPEDDVLDKVPRRVIKTHTCLPLFEDRGRLLVACVDEPSPALEDEMRLRFGMPMRAVLAVPRGVNQAIAKYYAPGMRDDAAEEQTAATSKSKSGKPGSEKSKPEKKEKPAPKQKAGKLTAEEKQQRTSLAAIAACWATIGTVGFGYFTNNQSVPMAYMAAGPILGAAVFGILKLTWAK